MYRMRATLVGAGNRAKAEITRIDIKNPNTLTVVPGSRGLHELRAFMQYKVRGRLLLGLEATLGDTGTRYGLPSLGSGTRLRLAS